MPPKQNLISTMILGAGHSIMVPHAPTIPPGFSEKFFEAAKTNKESISKFGLFSNIDYNTYFPEVQSKDFNPEKDEFIEPIFRLLSNCIVSKNSNPTEFPADVLKASMPLLVGQTVNCDHETNIGNAIGSVVEVFWQEAYKTSDGQEIPAGINGKLKIDAKANPRIARGINMDPPSIHSNSVTVQFEWKPSHDFENPLEFWDKLGTYDENGNMIRRIATRIISYKETSLVSHGADPFAQLLDNKGKIINPGYASSVYNSFSEVIKEKISHSCRSVSTTDYKNFEEVSIMYNTSESNNEGKQPFSESTNQNKSKNQMNQELKEFLDQLFGEGMLTLGEGASVSTELCLTEVKRLIKEKADLTTELTEVKNNVTTLKDEVKTLKEAANENQSFIEMGKNHLKEFREATVASYKKLTGEEKVDAHILDLIEKTPSLELLVSLKATYDAQLEEKYPLHCADCGSHNVNRGSSISTKENEEKSKVRSNEDILNTLAEKTH